MTMDNLVRLRWVILGILIAVAVVSSVVALLSGSQWQDALLNLGTEMAGAVVTYALFELIIERRERSKVRERELESRKAELIAQMGSRIRDVAVAAAEELRRRDWLQDGTLKGANLRGADLQGVDLRGTNLQGADLRYANLQGANLRGADLQEADMSSAVIPLFGPQPPHPHEYRLWATSLRGAILEGANLQGANLTGVDLQEADLRFARLQKANLSGASLCRAALGRAQLQEADLREADLQKADLNDANLEGALADEDTVWPEGFEVPEGVVIVDFSNLIDGGNC
jgi:uncharacterized protein YjbI with pentapeptide repeats